MIKLSEWFRLHDKKWKTLYKYGTVSLGAFLLLLGGVKLFVALGIAVFVLTLRQN